MKYLLNKFTVDFMTLVVIRSKMLGRVLVRVTILLFAFHSSTGQFSLFTSFPSLSRLPSLPPVPAQLKSGWTWLNSKKELANEEYSDKYYATMSQHKNLKSGDEMNEVGNDFRSVFKNSIPNFIHNVKNPLDALDSGRSMFTRSNTAAKAYIGCEYNLHDWLQCFFCLSSSSLSLSL